MFRSLRIGVEFSGVVAGVNKIFNRTLEIASPLKMQGELRRNLRGTLPVMADQLLAGLPMKHDATLVDQISVQEILIERVGKTISRSQRCIG